MRRFWKAMLLLLLVCGLCLQAQAADLAVERKVYDYLTNEMGLSSAAACGVLANIEQESGFRLSALGDNGTSYGLCQWHDSRYDNLKTYCIGVGLDYRSVEGQMAFLSYELRSTYSSLLAALRSVSNDPDGAYSAAHMWCIQFERPANMEELAVQRGILAKGKYWNRYNGLVLVQQEEPDMTVEEVIRQIREDKEVVIPEPPQAAAPERYYEEPEESVLPRAPYIPRHRPQSEQGGSLAAGFAAAMLFMPMIFEERRRLGLEMPEKMMGCA